MNKIVIYDFDGTLTPYTLTILGILDECGYVGGGNNLDFIKLVEDNVFNNNLNVYEAFFKTLFEIIHCNGYMLCDDTLIMGVDQLKYNDGVYEFLEYLYNNGVDNYIISAGMKCFLDKIKIRGYFRDVYATTFKYKDGEIVGIDSLVTDKEKIACVKDIMNKNKLDSCSNIVYIGDGLTDLPVMEFVKNNGGTSIFLGDNEVNGNVVSYCLKRDYRLNGDIIKVISELFDI